MNPKPLQWDIFCHVIDNHGDLGVSWRLAADLAQRGHTVRLWVDDPSALAWMAPHGATRVEVLPWTSAEQAHVMGDVVVEAFGCRLPQHVEGLIAKHACIWINLEYLSAERFVQASHGLPSPVMQGHAKGHTKWFFYPGFELATGGLIRESNLLVKQSRFDRLAWLSLYAPQAFRALARAPHQLVSLFCYEPRALKPLLAHWVTGTTPTVLLVTQGRAQQALTHALDALQIPPLGAGALRIEGLPYLSQENYDHLLWSCDLNFVRGEDSLVRALWACKPFVWQIYPQEDGAHAQKLQALCEVLQMPNDLQALHQIWNHLSDAPVPSLNPLQVSPWTSWMRQTHRNLALHVDLVTQLEQFVSQKR